MATQRKRSTTNKKSQSKSNKTSKKQQSMMGEEILLLSVLAISILLLLSVFGVGGAVGKVVSTVIFGIFGFMAYFFPFAFFLSFAFAVSNKGNKIAAIKVISGVVFFICICALMELIIVKFDGNKRISDYYTYASINSNGGGFVGGVAVKFLSSAFGVMGTYVIIIILMIICVVVITERSFLNGVKKGSKKVYNTAKDDAAKRRERKEQRIEQRMDRKVKGVALDTQIPVPEDKNEEIREIAPSPKAAARKARKDAKAEEQAFEAMSQAPFPPVDFTIHREETTTKVQQEPFQTQIDDYGVQTNSNFHSVSAQEKPEELHNMQDANLSKGSTRHNPKSGKGELQNNIGQIGEEMVAMSAKAPPQKEYIFPPIHLLKKANKNNSGDSDRFLKETARKLQQTLHNFGVNVTVTNISCGPSVTRYELQPEQGVKVSRIVNLSDDIKLNLAAADIRIEAPIPGKAAVGIEVPNKENSTVMFRELIESTAFRNNASNLSFAVGKDIGGKVIVADIAKMPHLLIAGATGSGKSVCINTLIMSILYKAKPEDVKLIMIDPKVVELSVYNGIPHLFIPVVTDPKKAAGALNWAVAEMTDRYQKFAEYNVRDLKGYNAKIESIKDIADENKPEKLPQIVIIVDELADLMMVAPGEVEDAICRLAQLARAAGIHLIIATQRPSVNVITGLIKANMPSRIAFSVSSGVDSRTIIDMNGAEKLLGKGDMLFYPQGYQKPARVQGAFITDKEVSEIVDFLTKQNEGAEYNIEVEEKINSTGQTVNDMDSGISERDAYFKDAGKFIIEKDKASIGMLQRMFKIGFNRAARIMDQLADAGVVGEEEGTKPRKVLMSMEEFEAYIDEYV